MINNINPFFITDGYKTGHHKMYPKGTTLVYSNFTPRHGHHSNIENGKGIISFGQQMIIKQIKEMFDEGFFMTRMYNNNGKEILKNNLLKKRICQKIKKEYSLYLGTDYDISHIESLWDLGYLPLEIKAVPEGVFIPYGVPVLTIVNTKPEFFWLTNFLETMISNMLWMPMTAATTAYEYKKILSKACIETDHKSIDFVNFQGHNFGMRGMAGIDATIYSGLGHATSFKGDDSLPTIIAARKYYNEKEFVVGSVNATEHSVMSAGGSKKGDELNTFRYLMKQFPTGILSIVSDTWNLWVVLIKYLPELKEEILKRDGKIVIRPDSGDPVDIICGKKHWTHSPDENITDAILYYYPNDKYIPMKEEVKGVIELLWDLFGGTINSQGYKVLDPHIGAIYGDSITLERAKQITERLKTKGFASTNVVLGIGSYTYQYVTRDTHGFAMKATYVEIDKTILCMDGKTIPEKCDHPMCIDHYGCSADFGQAKHTTICKEIFKDPITGDGSKKSAKGLLKVNFNIEEEYFDLEDQVSWEQEKLGMLRTIFKNGKFYNPITLTEIRKRINKII